MIWEGEEEFGPGQEQKDNNIILSLASLTVSLIYDGAKRSVGIKKELRASDLSKMFLTKKTNSSTKRTSESNTNTNFKICNASFSHLLIKRLMNTAIYCQFLLRVILR